MLFPENTYGSLKRLKWIISNSKRSCRILEFGCGTGCMITLPLCLNGFDAYGVDNHVASISYGKGIFNRYGIDSSRLSSSDLNQRSEKYDVIIASEVLEHIPSDQINDILSLLRSCLSPDGILLVTVPNGYGSFEFENFLWNRLWLGKLFITLRIPGIAAKIKRVIFGSDGCDVFPNTLSDEHSPHVQQFTYSSIQTLLEKNNFIVTHRLGSVLFAGPISNTFITGVPVLLRINNYLGHILPQVASGFYLCAHV